MNTLPDDDPQALAQALVEEIRRLLRELHPGRTQTMVSLDSSLDRDLGFDSLGRMELLYRLGRRFDRALPERLFAEAETPQDLLQAVLQATHPNTLLQPLTALKPVTDTSVQATPTDAETLVAALEWHVRHHPDRPHIHLYADEAEGEMLTYRQLFEQSQRVAAGLQAVGVAQGQAVAIMLPTSADYFFSFYGILLAGAVPVPMYPPPRMAQLEEHLRRYVAILANCAAPVMITVTEGKAQAKRLCALVGSLSRVVSCDDLLAVGKDYVQPWVQAGDLAFLQYTSGSTGNPKGVMLTHANLLANVRAMGEAVQVQPDDVFVSWLPLYHDMGLIGAWLGSLYHALPLVVMPPLSFIAKPQRWLQAIHRHRGTLSASPNFGYEICLRRIEDKDLAGLDLSCWRAAFNGAEAVVPETLERFIERFQAYGFRREAMVPVYGLAESSVGLGFPPPNRGPWLDRIQRGAFSRQGRAIPADPADANALRFVACGLPLPGHQIRIVDEAGRELPERRQGRVQFQGPSSTSGYFHHPEQTRALFDGDWLDSGDLGYLVGGELFVTGRRKDLIIRAGRNIYPQEVEQAVSEIDGIRKDCVAVFGGLDASTGTERLIVLAETRRLDGQQAQALKTLVNAVVTNLLGEPPDDIVLAPPGAVLKTSSGKIRRSAIREMYQRGEVGKPRQAAWLGYLRLAWEGWGFTFRQWAESLKAWGFAVYAWACFLLMTPMVWGLVMLLPGLPSRWKAVRAGCRFLQHATQTKLRIDGLENLPAESHALVIVANHASYLDVFALTAALPYPTGFVAKAEFSTNRWLAPALRRIGTQFVERFDAEKAAADASRLTESLQQARPLVFFPEGTFTRQPGLLPFHLGAFLAAVDADVPVIPVAIRGTRSMLRGGGWFPHRGIIHITIGKALLPLLRTQAERWNQAIALRDAAREHILRHCGEPDLDRSVGVSHARE